MRSGNSPRQGGSWKVRLARAEGAVSRRYRCSRRSLCLLNRQAFPPASSMKNPIQRWMALPGATFTSGPTRNACSTFRKVMGPLGTAQLGTPSPRYPSLQHGPRQVYTTAMSQGETGTFRPGTLEQQAGFFCAFSTFLVPKGRGVPLRS